MSLRGATKLYSGVRALSDLTLDLYPGEVLALVGENGSGKSTACKLIAGVIQPDAGHIECAGEQVTLQSPAQARQRGIAMVYQEFSLIESMTIGQNMQVGREPRFFTESKVNSVAQGALARLNFLLEPSTLVSKLGSAQKQMVEIAKAVGTGARTILFDEPTATLTPEEKRQLFYIIEGLRQDGYGIVFVSHVLEEALEHADRIVVLRDGEHQITAPAKDLSRAQLVRHMVGRDVHFTKLRAPQPVTGEALLSVRALSAGSMVRSMSFSVRPGEVVGIAGLVGAGRSESAQVIVGAVKRDRVGGGVVRLKGRPLRVREPRGAIKAGVAYVTEDRKRDGFFETMSARDNIYIAWLAKYGKVIARKKLADDLYDTYSQRLSIRGKGSNVKEFSGGNQQKVVIAKALAQNPDVVIFDEPTRGVDVGAIESIHQLIREVADNGKAVVVISSYLPEVMAVSDRVLVSRAGKIVAEFDPDEATEDDILFAAVH